MKKGNPKPLSTRLRGEVKRLAAMPVKKIDTTEMPEIQDWSDAVRGLFRPIKRPVSLRIDADVIEWFQKNGDGYQTRINTALREYVDKHRKRA